MEAMLDDECHAHIRHEARTFDNSGHEAARCTRQVEHDLAITQQKVAEAAEKKRKDDERVAKLRANTLIIDEEGLAKLRRPEIDLQLQVYRLDDKDTPAPSALHKKKVKKPEALLELRKAIARAAARSVLASDGLESNGTVNVNSDSDMEEDNIH